MKRFLFLLTCWLPLLALAQTPTQTIRGQVIDADTGQALVGAKVILVDSEPAIGAITDKKGKISSSARSKSWSSTSNCGKSSAKPPRRK